MSFVDLNDALNDWPYKADKISVRKIRNPDGMIKIQQRVELGIVQMDAEGRPDGRRPFDHGSLVEYHQDRLEEHLRRNGTFLGFGLTHDDCLELREEASMYHRRYVASFVLEDFDRVIGDTRHNLALLDLLAEYSLDTEDARCLEAFRPYILMMNARALAHEALQTGAVPSALAHVNRGLLAIRHWYLEQGYEGAYARSGEVNLLHKTREKILEEFPLRRTERLRRELDQAVEEERFEDAARLRDQMQRREFDDSDLIE